MLSTTLLLLQSFNRTETAVIRPMTSIVAMLLITIHVKVVQNLKRKISHQG